MSCSTEENTVTAPGLNLPSVSFTLNNNVGTPVDTTSTLNYSNTYLLTVSSTGGDVSLQATDYTFSFNPTSAITINSSTTNSVRFTVINVATTPLMITATHKKNAGVTRTFTLNLRNPNTTALTPFATDIQGNTVPNLASANALTREVLTPLGVATSTPLVKRYATEAGAGSRDGSSWANAWAATNLRNGINAITDASTSKIYLVMIAGGTYKPVYGTSPSREISFRMTNHVAIMGGFEAEGGWARTGTTLMSGDIGVAGNADNSYHVFFHDNIPLDNSHLYGVTITNGNANAVVGIQALGGGMQNRFSSPNLTRVTFSGNSATDGGGMYNAASSPKLTQVTFSGNTAIGLGGGMYNTTSANPVLNQVVFSGNTAFWGGGMKNRSSANPVLNQVVFSGNTATGSGGGMHNDISSVPVIRNAVFSGNTATVNGGGMFNDLSSAPVIIGAVFSGNSAVNGGGMANNNNGGTGPRILNTIFSGNTTNGAGNGPDIAMDFAGGSETITIAGSVLGTYLTTGQPTNAIVGYGGSGTININYHHLTNLSVNLTGTATLTVNRMDFTYPTITTGSSAMNLGLYVRKHVNGSTTTYYYSQTGNGTSWYTGFSATGGFSGAAVSLPTTGTIEDMSATDITGKARTGRPDAGVNEL